MSKKNLSILIIVILFILSVIFCVPFNKSYKVTEVVSPTKFILGEKSITIPHLRTFDSEFSENNKELSKLFNISEEEAFVLGNLSKYWAKNLMEGRRVYIKDDNDLIFYKYSYRDKFLYSGYCIKNGQVINNIVFKRNLKTIRRNVYRILDLETDKVYTINDKEIRGLKNYLILRKSHLPENYLKKNGYTKPSFKFDNGQVKVIFSDSTSQLKPNRDCNTLICKEILNNINNSKKSIDIAIYGYSRVPEIEKALKIAQARGVKIRLVYDSDMKGENIYPDTSVIANLIFNNNNDSKSADARNIMHNKFYIFDEEILITGSANLSHTDMSGFNSNSIIVLKSSEVAKIYKSEFEQMYKGNFHTEKLSSAKLYIPDINVSVYFSPQDKAITNAVLPLIRNAKKYIYIPTFVLTEKRVTEELIRAKHRGVDVKIIIDALNASIKHSKHNELRLGNLKVKTENYAGKMHSKSMIVDDEYVIIGSMNFSNSGENKNDENLIVIKNSQVAKAYKDFFLYQWNKIDDKWLYKNVRAESKDSIGSCQDGLDNNYDGLTDMEDPACK